jgi:predicted nucleic acid-binding protein
LIFWDSSAIVPLLITEPDSDGVRAVLRDQPVPVVWWGTVVECRSALARSDRLHLITADAADRGRAILDALRGEWVEVVASEEVRERAATLVLRHPLRAADALQLGAALTWARGRPRQHRLLSFDARLCAAARGEGFNLVTLKSG